MLTKPNLHGFTAGDLQAEAERELKMRRRVYPRWVAQCKMTQPEAAAHLRKMEVIAELLGELAEGERLL